MAAKILPFKVSNPCKLLKSLREQEQNLGSNPLLEDWFEIRNKIRHVERQIKENRNDRNRKI